MTAGATFEADITDTGGADLDERGFVWDTTSRADPGSTDPANATYANATTETGTFGTGVYDYDVSTLQQNTTYYYRAVGHNSAGWNYGSEQSFTTPKQTVPTNVRISDSSTEDELTVAWDEVSTADGYEVYRAESSGVSKNDTNVASITSGTTTTFTDTGLEDGEKFYYVVTSTDGSVESDLSSEVNATTPLPAPSDVTAVVTDADGSGDYAYTIEWVNNDNSSDGGIDITANIPGIPGSPDDTIVSGLSPSTTSYTTSLGVPYSDVNVKRNTDHATSASGFVLTTGVPSNITVSQAGENQVEITHDTEPNADGYRYYRAETPATWPGDFTQVKQNDGNNNTSYTDTVPEDGEQYEYRVTAFVN